MLFKQIYNWLKYKTTTPSVLFKNRLFVERDSKHKRIFTNTGLTFRNLKWNSYKSDNIQSFFKFQYLKIFFFIFFTFFSIFFLSNYYAYYNASYFYNIFFFFWIGLDTFDYYLTFVIWVVFLSFSLLTSIMQSYFFFNNLLLTKKTYKNSQFIKNQSCLNFSNFSKKDYKFFLLHWLSTDKSCDRSAHLKNLFVTNSSEDFFKNYHFFFYKLYKAVRLLNLDGKHFSFFSLQLKLVKQSQYDFHKFYNLLTYSNMGEVLTKNSSIFLYYLIKNQKNYFDSDLAKNTSLSTLYSKSFWNSLYLLNINNVGTGSFKKINNFFQFDDVSANELTFFFKKNKSLNIFNALIENQIATAKWNRWLYKYSLLHRKVFKNSHKLTLTKKLFNAGFYNSSLTKKNLWNSEYFNKTNNFNLLHFTFPLLQAQNFLFYPFQTFNHSNNTYDSARSQLNILNSQETSFFWILKRFYFFSSLKVNYNFSNLIKKNKISSHVNQQPSLFPNSQIFLLKSFTNTSRTLTIENFDSIFVKEFQNLNPSDKDLYLLFNNLDLLDKDSLEILNWIVAPHLTINGFKTQLPFFFIKNFTKFNHFKFNKFYKNDCLIKNWHANYLTSLIAKGDHVYLKDFLFLLNFYQK